MAVWSLDVSLRAQGRAERVEGGCKWSQPCFWLPSSSSSESRVTGDPSQRHWRNCCLDPFILPFEFASFVSTSQLGTQLAPRNCISGQGSAFPGEQCYKQAKSGLCMLRKAVMYRLKAWGTISTKRCTTSFVSRQTKATTLR